MDLWMSPVSVFLLSWTITHTQTGPWLCIAETHKCRITEVAQPCHWALLLLLCPPAEICFLNVQTRIPNHSVWSLSWHYQEGFTFSIFVAAQQDILVISLSASLFSADAKQAQLPQPLLVSHKLAASGHFGSPPSGPLLLLSIPLQLGTQTRHRIPDGTSPEPSTEAICFLPFSICWPHSS